MKLNMIVSVAALALAADLGGSAAQAGPPTIVLVHGAFAGSDSWNGVIQILAADGYPVIAAANPLRGLTYDAAYVHDLVASIKGPVVLVGHSYAGSVISAAANASANVKALVFVSAFAPEQGETAAGLSAKFPGSTLSSTLGSPVATDGGEDLYIVQSQFAAQFAADVPAEVASLAAATQRPVTAAALNDPSPSPAWRSLPSWFVYGGMDLNIPPAALAFMAARAGSRETVVVPGASHLVMVSNPSIVAKVIVDASKATIN